MQRSSRTFSLKMLFGIVTVLAVSMAICAVGWRDSSASGVCISLGIVFAVISVPALVRASTIARLQREVGKHVAWTDRMRIFVESVGLIIGVWVSGFIAFLMVCYPVGLAGFAANSPILLVGALVAGIAAGGYVSWRILRVVWSDWI